MLALKLPSGVVTAFTRKTCEWSGGSTPRGGVVESGSHHLLQWVGPHRVQVVEVVLLHVIQHRTHSSIVPARRTSMTSDVFGLRPCPAATSCPPSETSAFRSHGPLGIRRGGESQRLGPLPHHRLLPPAPRLPLLSSSRWWSNHPLVLPSSHWVGQS